MVWAAFALMTVAVVLALLWPLARRRGAGGGDTLDTRFYADMLQEVDGEVERGLIASADAETTRAEIGRRLLAAARAGAGAPGAASGTRAGRLTLVAVALALVPLFSVGLYLRVGARGAPDEPLASRSDGADRTLAAAVARIEAHLVAHPEDGRGYEVIAPVFMRLGRYDDAVQADRAVIRTLGDSAAREATLGQAIMAAADGVVTAEARAAFDQAVALDPKLPQARFYLALAAEQDGDKARADTQWRALLADAPADAPWRALVEQHLAGAGGAPAVAPTAPAAGVPTGPAAASIAALPADQRLQAIRGMVEGLAGRLAQNGRDGDGWLRLIKAYTVLGEHEKAQAALGDARRGLAEDPAALARVETEAQALGLGG